MDELEALFKAGRSGKGRRMKKTVEQDNPVASFIRESRIAQGMTQKELSERAEVPLKTLREVEQGKATARMDTLNRILAYFGCEIGSIPITNKSERYQ